MPIVTRIYLTLNGRIVETERNQPPPGGGNTTSNKLRKKRDVLLYATIYNFTLADTFDIVSLPSARFRYEKWKGPVE
jgi:hypothetical protein